jgi:hypothetical protein
MPPSTVVTLIRLYPLYCTLYLSTLTLTRWQLPAQVALSFVFVSDSFRSILQCTLHWLQLSKRFLLKFHVEIYNFSFFLLEVGRSYHSTQFWTHLFSCCAIFSCAVFSLLHSFSCCTCFSTLGQHGPGTHIYISFLFLTLCKPKPNLLCASFHIINPFVTACDYRRVSVKGLTAVLCDVIAVVIQ